MNAKKDAESNYYDKQLTALEKANKAQEIEDEVHYKDMLSEKKAYNRAEEMIVKGQHKEMYDLFSKYSESYKTMGVNLADSVEASLKRISDAINNLNSLKSNTTSSGKNYTVQSNGDIASDTPLSASERDDIYGGSSGSSNGSGSLPPADSTSSSYSDNYYASSDSYYDEASKSYKKYATGTDNAQAGYATVAEDGFEILIGQQVKKLKGGETILNNSTSKNLLDVLGNDNNKTSKIDQIYDYIKSTGSILSNLNTYAMPNYFKSILPTNLNNLASSITNNTNTDNSSYQPVEMSVSIINQNGAEAVMNEKTLEKMVTKVVQKNATKFGGKGFTNR